MSSRDKLIFLIGAMILIIIGIAVVFLLSRTSSQVSTIFGKIETPDIDSIIHLRSKILVVDFKNDEEVPKTAQVYKINEKQISNEDALQIAINLGFNNKPRGGSIPTWENKNSTLYIDRVKRSLDLKYRNVKPRKGKFSVEKLAEIALKFIQKSGLQIENLTPDTINYRLLTAAGDELEVTADLKKPILIEIGFNRKLDQYNVFYPSPEEPAAAVILNNKGQISRVYYKFADINKTTSGTYPLVDINKLEVGNLVNLGSLVFPQSRRGVFEPQLVKTITIEDFSLAYLDDQVGEVIQPIYILRGYASVGKENISVVIYYPALGEKWLK